MSNDNVTLAKAANIPAEKPPEAKQAPAAVQPVQPVQKPVLQPVQKPVQQAKPAEKPDNLLVSILRTKRAHGSAGDTNFRMWLHAELKRMGHTPITLAEGCVLVRTDPKSDTLFSCHIDTVHSTAESDGSHQDLLFDPTFNQIFLQKGQKSSCLGADDGAGIYIMLKMIKAKVPGSYIFHTGEERSGIGSRAVLAKHRELLEDFSRAIAFDRKCALGDSPEVIVTQGGRTCGSVAFGSVLVDELNRQGGFAEPWVISHGGSFTDTKVYADVIPECINLSCFYEQAHTSAESLDVEGLEALVQAACNIKWDNIKAVRKPAAEPVYNYKPPKGAGSAQRSFRDFEADQYGGFGDFPMGPPKLGGAKGKHKSHLKAVEPKPPSILEEIQGYTAEHFQALVEEEPDMAARVMAALTLKIAGLEAQVAFVNTYLDIS